MDMADLGIKAGQHVLFVWTQPSTPTTLKEYAGELHTVVGADGKVSVENVERLSLCESPVGLIFLFQVILGKTLDVPV